MVTACECAEDVALAPESPRAIAPATVEADDVLDAPVTVSPMVIAIDPVDDVELAAGRATVAVGRATRVPADDVATAPVGVKTIVPPTVDADEVPLGPVGLSPMVIAIDPVEDVELAAGRLTLRVVEAVTVGAAALDVATAPVIGGMIVIALV